MSGAHGGSTGSLNIAGNNTVTGQDNQASLEVGLIYFFDGDPSCNLILANVNNISWWTNWGMNNIFLDPYNNGYLSNYQYVIAFPSSSPTINLGNIDNNFWGLGPTGTHWLIPNYDGSAEWDPVNGDEIDITTSITYNTSSCTPQTAQLPDGSTLGYGCDTSLGYPIIEKKSLKPLSLDSIPPQTPCQYLYGQGYAYNANSDWQDSYDTLQLFVERCPFNPEPTPSWEAFSLMGGDAQFLYSLSGGNDSIYKAFHQWLESVLC